MANSRNWQRTEVVEAAVADCLDRRVYAGQRLLIGYSGGLDSTVLLHALMTPARARGVDLAACHVNHGLSPDADAWEAHCRAQCAAWQLTCAVHRVAVERDSADGLEAAARRARHAAYLLEDAEWVVLAHHRDDQAETLLFNLLRGTGLRGAAAMNESRQRLLRPLLGVARADLVAYAAAHQLDWIEDESNVDTHYSRNHLRHEVLAGLEVRFPGSSANLAAAASRFGEALQLLDALACADLGAATGFPIAVARLRALDEPRARNALRYLLQSAGVGISSEARLREATQQLLHAAADRHPLVIFGRHALRRVRGMIVLETQGD